MSTHSLSKTIQTYLTQVLVNRLKKTNLFDLSDKDICNCFFIHFAILSKYTIMKTLLFSFILILTSPIILGQTTLSPGEMAIIGIGGDNPDNFHFVFLVDIESGTEIIFTDSGWKSDNTFRGLEGATKYTAPSALNAGTVISYVTNSANFTSANDVNVGTNGFNLSTQGD